ncbi:mutator protein [Hordeum vulgare]|nr:mutator protein [Hordeum vulgare]
MLNEESGTRTGLGMLQERARKLPGGGIRPREAAWSRCLPDWRGGGRQALGGGAADELLACSDGSRHRHIWVSSFCGQLLPSCRNNVRPSVRPTTWQTKETVDARAGSADWKGAILLIPVSGYARLEEIDRRRARLPSDLLYDHRMMWLLNDVYDVEYRAYLMSEKKMELTPLKIRSHGASTVMKYDERYTPYIEMTGLLPFIQLVSRSTPNLNAATVTALIDRWRPETHSFHLRTREMTFTLQDVSMITALPIEGKPLCMSTDSEGWRQQMEALIDMSPLQPEVEDGGKKDRVPAGAPFTWIAANFAHCPEEANDEVIQRYARMYMWYVISRNIFADGSGKNAPWMWLKALTVFDNKFSWGSAALAYLYQQLDDACRRSTKDGGVGGCMLLLSVEWQPYGAGPNFGDAHTFELNPLCLQEKHLWLMCCPLICNWAVEFHLPHRVMHQFGLFQPHPPEWVDTDTQLHGLDRRRQGKIKDWHKHHKNYVIMFEQSVQAASSAQRTQHRQHCPLAFNNYVRWFQESTRVEICPPAYEEDILEEPTEYDALAHGDYNKLIREGYQTSFAPVLNFVEQGKKLRRLSNILGCRDPEYVSPSRSGSSQRNTLDGSASSGTPMDDGDITSAANTQRNNVEDDVDTPEVADGMMLKAFQRSAYMLKPRKEFRRYSPDDYAKGKNPVVGGSRLSRMRSMDDEDEDDDDDESDDPEQFVVARRKKLVSKRGRGPKM